MFRYDATGCRSNGMNASSAVNRISMEMNGRIRLLTVLSAITQRGASGNKIYPIHLCYYAMTKEDKQVKLIFRPIRLNNLCKC